MKVGTKTWSFHQPCGDKAIHVTLSNGRTLLLLSDGMNGYEHPDKAAEIAVEAVAQYMVLHEDDDPAVSIPQSFVSADKAIYSASCELHTKMGAALTLLLADRRQAFFAHVGDVRLYHVSSGGTITQLTQDHHVFIDGTFYLTQSIRGMGLRQLPQVHTLQLNPSDRWMLCTDGAYRYHPISRFLDEAWKELPVDKPEDDCTIVWVSEIE